MELAVLIPTVRRICPAGQAPKSLFSCEGQGQYRIGVRAFSTLEGYAGRNRRNGVGFSREVRKNARPPSRLSSEIGTKADAKQQTRASVRVRDSFLSRALSEREPHGSVRGCCGWVGQHFVGGY
jgi:hypothetical protein